jgi:hypothetical protein
MHRAELWCDTDGGENVCHKSIQQTKSITPIYIYKNVLSVCARALVPANFRKCFTDGIGIWTQRCRRIRAWLGLTFIYICATRWHRVSTERKHVVARPGTQRALSGKSHIPKLMQEQNTGDGVVCGHREQTIKWTLVNGCVLGAMWKT